MDLSQRSLGSPNSAPRSSVPILGRHRQLVNVILTKRTPDELADYTDISELRLNPSDYNLSGDEPLEIIGEYVHDGNAFYYASMPDGMAYRVGWSFKSLG